MSATTVERIGTCELCGITDHHLVDGVCPTCRSKCLMISVSGEPGFIARARTAFLQLGECARLALANLEMPDESADAPSLARGPRLDLIGDENMGDEAGVPREALR